MTAICTGMALHGGIIPYHATFLVFSDYARNAVRMSALIGAHVIHVYTHDSIGLGEDGPTHQPIEHVSSLRLIPGLEVWRPCDTVESAIAWKHAIENSTGPSALVFTRQKLAHQERSESQLENIPRGGYVLREAEGDLKVAIMATGSEVEIAVKAAGLLEKDGVGARVVSMPNPELFLRQDEAYRNSVLPPELGARVAVEAGVPMYWYSFVGGSGRVVGIDRFGASAPGDEIYEHYGLTAEHVRQAALETLENH
jgi:transketolase